MDLNTKIKTNARNCTKNSKREAYPELFVVEILGGICASCD